MKFFFSILLLSLIDCKCNFISAVRITRIKSGKTISGDGKEPRKALKSNFEGVLNLVQKIGTRY